MRLTPENKFKKLIVIGDRVLVRPTKPNERTESGLVCNPELVKTGLDLLDFPAIVFQQSGYSAYVRPDVA